MNEDQSTSFDFLNITLPSQLEPYFQSQIQEFNFQNIEEIQIWCFYIFDKYMNCSEQCGFEDAIELFKSFLHLLFEEYKENELYSLTCSSNDRFVLNSGILNVELLSLSQFINMKTKGETFNPDKNYFLFSELIWSEEQPLSYQLYSFDFSSIFD